MASLRLFHYKSRKGETFTVVNAKSPAGRSLLRF